MKRWLLVVLVACGESKPAGPLDVLRDPKQAWTYEVVHGPSIDKLVPAAGQPPVICKIREWEETYSRKPSTLIRCSPTSLADNTHQVTSKQLFLVFDKRGVVRELPGPASPASEKGFALGFTFPSKVDGTWTYDRGGALSKVEVRAGTAMVMGKEREVWTSSSTYTWSADEPAKRGAAMFAPGVAPVLLCDIDDEHWCLRLVGRAPKPKARPKLVHKVPSTKERTELVTWLTTMDHDRDMIFDLMAGKLVVRDDVPRIAAPYRMVVEIDAKEIRLQGQAMANAAELSTKLADAQRKIAETIDAGRVPRSEDPTAMREQLYFAIAADVPWQTVADALAAADAAGFRQPLLVFARAPKVPPPPKTWVDDVVAQERFTGNLAESLGKITKEVLADCDDLRAAFALDDSGGTPMADQLVAQLAAAIPKSTCAYDLPVLRSTLWFTLGTPYPQAVLPMRVKPELPADLPWRAASKHFKP